VAGDGDPGAAGHCGFGGTEKASAFCGDGGHELSAPKADKLCDADSRDGGTKPKVGR